MKKTLFFLWVCLSVFPALRGQCDITITGDFDSECIYDDKLNYGYEQPHVLIACKNSPVTYTAYINTLPGMAASYTWEVFGDASHSASGNQVSVTWGGGDWGMVVVTVVSAPGDTCTEYCRVQLVDVPVVGSSSVPAYSVLPSGSKVIRVCRGATVEFFDHSLPGESDIAGYLWSCRNATAPSTSTPHYTLENILQDEVVTHRVYNNCGCYDEETFTIEVLRGTPLELDCYGTVCKGAEVTYTLLNPTGCHEYYWYVEDGTLVGGQGTASPTVQWGHPSTGYGVLGLDGNLCGGQACPTLMSVKVPVISDSLALTGQSEVCVGEAVIYSLPLFGSTEYTWSVTPSTGVDISMVTPSHEAQLVFNRPGIYTLECSYRCDFLGCGPYAARPLTVTVKPPLEIVGHERICRTNACSLTVTPAVSAEWTAYDLGSGNSVAATATGSSFSHTFSAPGRYLVTASHPSYCGPATFVLTVADTPPAPTVDDLSPSNRHTACPYQGIVLAGTPANPNYSLVWEPDCLSAPPQQYSGDEVTIPYQSEVCNVLVYHYDRELQCFSSPGYVHTVSRLEPLPLTIPANITVCPGSTIYWGPDRIPDQSAEGMLYEWSIEDTKQYCASVQGGHFTPSVTWTVHEINTPQTFYVKLRRTYCGGFTDTIIPIRVVDSTETALSIAGAGTVCIGTQASYTGSGGTPANYTWTVEDHSYTGNPITHEFHREGVCEVLLQSHPYTYCNNSSHLSSVVKNVVVKQAPMVQGLVFDDPAGTVSVVPPPVGYTCNWTYRLAGGPMLDELIHAATINHHGVGDYCCTVVDPTYGCSTMVCDHYDGEFPIQSCDTLHFTSSYDPCTHTLSLTADHYATIVNWTASGGGSSIEPSGVNNRQADIVFDNIGIYTVTATSGFDPYYKGKFVQTVEFIPDLSFVAACNKIIIHNNSRYKFPGGTVYLEVSDGNGLPVFIQFPVSQTSYTYTPAPFSGTRTFSFNLIGYGAINNIVPPCPLGNVEIGQDSYQISIDSDNGSNTCDNTPIQLTASLNYTGSIISSTWNFDDGSSYHTPGNYIYHTFKNQNSDYNVYVTITDNHGCTRNSSIFPISSHLNNLDNESLEKDVGYPCPNTFPIRIYYTFPYGSYEWWSHRSPTQDPGSYQYLTYVTDDYFVHVTDNNYCQKEASTFVMFPNAPTARISAEKFRCCVGEELTLLGAGGPNASQYSYSWNVTGPSGYTTSSLTDPDLTFSSSVPGTYTVTLTVSSTMSPYCSSTTSEIVTVTTPPAAPTLAISGNACIGNAPVTLAASLPSSAGSASEVHWSNGATGLTADYYTHGLATAYYYDPAIGCRSQEASIRIHKEPDFDALLTGCYKKCKGFFTYSLPVFGLTDNGQTVGWNWKRNDTLVASGSDDYSVVPLTLPVAGPGTHQLTVSYAGCTKTSPSLTLSIKDTCDCDSVQVTSSYTYTVEDCKIVYHVNVTVCNLSQVDKFCIRSLKPLNHDTDITILQDDLTGATVNNGDCGTFTLEFMVSSLEPPMLLLQLVDKDCSNCAKVIAIDLRPDINCVRTAQGSIGKFLSDLSSPVAGYFLFDMAVGPGSLLAFWSEPPMVLNYLHDPILQNVTGLGMVDVALLTQLVADNSEICFHALVCEGDDICEEVYCISASTLYQMLQDILPGQRSKGTPPADTDAVGLKPNPTTGEVSVIGTADAVAEVLVLDMNGRAVASFTANAASGSVSRFNISDLPSGVYIVRLRTRHSPLSPEKIHYLKLVKK